METKLWSLDEENKNEFTIQHASRLPKVGGATIRGNTVYSGGSRISRKGGVDSRGGYVSKILYVKTKESGPLGGVCQVRPL